jgi:hypothetical protein
MFKFFIFALILALASAFSPMKALASRNMALNDFKINTDPTKRSPDGRCLAKDLDAKGRCPGDAGYKPPVGNGSPIFKYSIY